MIIPLHLASLTLPEDAPGGPGPYEVMAWLIRAEEMVVLVDTGPGIDNEYINSRYQPSVTPLVEALAKVDTRLEDIDNIINTHLHFDHCGSNVLFQDTPIYVQTVEFDAAMEPRYTVFDWWDPFGVHYHQVVGDYSLSKEIRIIATPGHTAGHQSVIVTENGETRVIAGQAVHDIAEWEAHLASPGTRDDADDTAAYRDSVRRLLELDAVEVHFSHDTARWGK